MLSVRFNQLFRRLVGAFERHQDVDRHPDNVRHLGTARIELDICRREIAEERERLAGPTSRQAHPSRTSVSHDDLARLRVHGGGFVSG